MPELPDITVYLECLAPRILGRELEGVRLQSASLLRTVDPPLAAAHGRTVSSLTRVGKRIAIGLHRPGGAPDDDDEIFLVIHLMIAGRLRWRPLGTAAPARRCHAILDFETGCLLLTEASAKKRATLHCVRGRAALRDLDPGGLELEGATLDDFARALTRENHTLKRALTDPHLLSGIGNAYSDEILHRAGMSPVKWTSRLSRDDLSALYDATREVLAEWTGRLRAEVGDGFPEKVTAFREGMAVHGRFREPCPVCGSEIQRIVKGHHETNYCPTCQTGGRLLADRALSQLLKKDWPRTLEELEERRETGTAPRRGSRRAATPETDARGIPGARRR